MIDDGNKKTRKSVTTAGGEEETGRGSGFWKEAYLEESREGHSEANWAGFFRFLNQKNPGVV